MESSKEQTQEVTLLPGFYTVGVHEGPPDPGRYRVRPKSRSASFVVNDNEGKLKVCLFMNLDDEDDVESFVFDLELGDKIEAENTVIFTPSK